MVVNLISIILHICQL